MNLDALRKMAAMGLTIEQALEVLECLDAPRARSSNAERLARGGRAFKVRTVTDLGRKVAAELRALGE